MTLRRRRLTAALSAATLASTLLIAAPPAQAATASLASAFRVTSTLTGFYPTYTAEAFSSPSVANVVGDANLEVVVGGLDGYVVVANTSGQVLNRFNTGAGAIQGSPTLVDISGDGLADIVATNVNGDVVAFSGSGQELFRKRTCTYPGKPCDVFGTVAVADLDTDGQLDLISTSSDHYLHAWHLDGSYLAGFPLYLQDTTWASPAIADIDGDAFPEIVVAVDVDYVTAGHVGCPSFGAAIYAIEHNGAMKWKTCIPGEIIMASPAIADIDADGALEIAIGSGVYFGTTGQPIAPSRRLHVLEGNGAHVPGWPVDIGGVTLVSPALGQLDGDAPLEIATSSDAGEVRVYNSDASLQWSSCARGGAGCPVGIVNAMGSPVSIADVDSDGQQEVVSMLERTLEVRNGANGAVEASAVASYAYVNRSQPTIAQINGRAHILVAYLEEASGNGARSNGDRLVVEAWKTGNALGAADWPQFRRNQQHTGSFQTSWEGSHYYDAFLSAVYNDFLGRPIDESARRFWSGRLASDLTRELVALNLARSNEWAGRVVDGLYVDVLGRPAEAGGRGFWVSRLQGGSRVSAIAADLYGSYEYYVGAGGTDPAYVQKMYRAILRRDVDPGGLAYWAGRLGAGESRAIIAEQLFLSYESNARRVDALYATLLGRGTDAGGRDYWARYLIVRDDIILAAELAGSAEYFGRAASR